MLQISSFTTFWVGLRYVTQRLRELKMYGEKVAEFRRTISDFRQNRYTFFKISAKSAF